MTYAQLRASARAIATRIDGSGAERLALVETNGPIIPAALFGAAWAGVSYAPLNYRLPDAQLAELLNRLEPSVTAATGWLTPDSDDTRSFPDAPNARRCSSSPAARRPSRRRRCSSTTSCSAYVFNTLEFALGRRGRSGARVGAAVPHRRGRRGAELHLRRASDRAAPRGALLGRGLARHRARRTRHPRDRRAHDARPHRAGDGSRSRPPRVPRCAISRTAAPACPRRCSNARCTCCPRPTS